MSLKTNILTLLLTAMASSTAQARDMKTVWSAMPDSVIRVIDHVRRLEMLDLVAYKVKAEVNNRLGTQSVMDTITDNYLHVTATKSSELSMRLLPTENGDTLICMVYTYKAPEPESEISFFDMGWQRLDASQHLPFKSMEEAVGSLYSRPDTMTEERYTELKAMAAVELVSASQHIDSDDMELELSIGMTPKDSQKSMAAIVKKRRMVWTGKKYE